MNRKAFSRFVFVFGLALVWGGFLPQPARAATILYVSNFNSNTVTAYDSAGRSLGAFVTGGPELSGANGLTFGRDGNLYVAGQFSNTLAAYNGVTGAFLRVLDPKNAAGISSPQGVAAGPDGRLYVASFDNGIVSAFDPASGAFVSAFRGLPPNAGLQDVVFGPDGNMYVSAFSSDRIYRVNPATGALVSAFAPPAGSSFSSFVSFLFGPDGNIYTGLVDPNSFTGEVAKYSPDGAFLGVFVPPGSGGLNLTGGIAFGPDGNLYLASVLTDSNFRDIGSSILRYDGRTGAPLGTFVGPKNGLNVPFSMVFRTSQITPQVIPEPGSLELACVGMLLCAGMLARRSKK